MGIFSNIIIDANFQTERVSSIERQVSVEGNQKREESVSEIYMFLMSNANLVMCQKLLYFSFSFVH